MAKSGWKESGMRLLPWLALGSLLALAAAGDDIPNIRVDVRLVRVLATVRDASGALLGDLAKSEFSVYDNEAEQQIAVFERKTEQPLSVALLVDISGSTAKDLKFEVDSVSRFLRDLFKEGNQEDSVGLYSFNYRVTQETPFSRSPDRLDRALHNLHGSAGTSMYDAIYFAARDLARPERPQGARDCDRWRRHHQFEGLQRSVECRAVGRRGDVSDSHCAHRQRCRPQPGR